MGPWSVSGLIMFCGAVVRARSSHSGAGKYALLRSRVNAAVLTVSSESQKPGTPVIMAGERPSSEDRDDQLWFFQENTGVLRTALNDFCLDISGVWPSNIKGTASIKMREIDPSHVKETRFKLLGRWW